MLAELKRQCETADDKADLVTNCIHSQVNIDSTNVSGNECDKSKGRRTEGCSYWCEFYQAVAQKCSLNRA